MVSLCARFVYFLSMCIGLDKWEMDKVKVFEKTYKAFSKKAGNFEGTLVCILKPRTVHESARLDV
jgi:hypothetical protein